MTAAASSMVGSAAKPAVNSPNSVEPMPTITASTSTLMPEEMTSPSTRSAMKAVLSKSPKGTSTKPASVASLNSISVTKSWMLRMKKERSTDRPGEQQDRDLQEILEEGDEADQLRRSPRGSGGRPRARSAAMRPGCSSSAAAIPPPAAISPSPAKLSKTMRASTVPVADDVGEDADEERLADEARDDVVVGPPGPEERGERDVDDDERGG